MDTIHQERSKLVRNTMREIESVLADGVDVKSIEKAKAHLLELAKRRDLFN